MRVNPELVSFTAPTAWKEIYGYPGVKKFKKSGCRQLRPEVPDLLTANGPDHARQRVALNRAFSDRALREQEHIEMFLTRMDQRYKQDNKLMIRQTQILVDQLGEKFSG